MFALACVRCRGHMSSERNADMPILCLSRICARAWLRASAGDIGTRFVLRLAPEPLHTEAGRFSHQEFAIRG